MHTAKLVVKTDTRYDGKVVRYRNEGCQDNIPGEPRGARGHNEPSEAIQAVALPKNLLGQHIWHEEPTDIYQMAVDGEGVLEHYPTRGGGGEDREAPNR